MRLRFPFVIVASFVVFLTLPPVTLAATDWKASAHSLDSEDPVVRRSAERELKTIPNLPQKLRKALTSAQDAADALKVIETLLLRDLLSEVMTLGKNDSSGRALLTVKLLREKGNTSQVDDYFRALAVELTQADHASRKVAILEGLPDRTNLVTDSQSLALLVDPSHEVRIEYADYIGRVIKNDPTHAFAKWKSLLSAQPYQVRLKAIYAVRTLSNPSSEYVSALESCVNDHNVSVRSLCADTRKDLGVK